MRRPVLTALLLGGTLLGASLPGAAAAQTAVERAQRQLDEGIRQDRFLDAALDARGDARDGSRSGAVARVDELDADRAPFATNRGLQEGSGIRPGSSPIAPIPSLGDNVQR